MARLDTAIYRAPHSVTGNPQAEASATQSSTQSVTCESTEYCEPAEYQEFGKFADNQTDSELLDDPSARPRVSAGGNRSTPYRVTKRVVDIVGATSLLVLLSPLLLLTCLVLTITTRGRPFFCQTRYGLHGEPFTLFKFRTMVTNAEDLGHLVQRDGLVFKKRDCEDPRVTRIGALLRKTSIDELPQLANVLLGQMSLVGPRPLSAAVDRFEPWQLDRFSVRPGLTCLWQVSGRSEIGFEEWMHMDLWYVKHQSLRIDAILLLRTPATVLSCRGAG